MGAGAGGAAATATASGPGALVNVDSTGSIVGVFVAVGWTVVDDSFDSLPLMSASAVKTLSAAVETKLS